MTRVKICGLRNPQDARAARDAGADLLGVIFAKSPRRASLAQARAIRAAIGPRIELLRADTDHFDNAIDELGRPLLVGVFAGQPADEIVRIAAEADLDLIQLSGGEHPELIGRLTRPVIRVHHVGAETNADVLLARIAQGPPSVAALDTQSARGGGSGRTFDWAIAAAIAAHPADHAERRPDAGQRRRRHRSRAPLGRRRRLRRRAAVGHRPAAAGRQVARAGAGLHRERARRRRGVP